MDDIAEHDLVKRASAGDLPAFEGLVRAHEGSVRAFFRVRLFDWSMADDLAQDVFVTAFKRIGTFRGESRFGAWLRGIATNHLRNYLRKRRDEPVGGGQELQELLTEQVNLHYEEQAAERDALLDEAVMLKALAVCMKKLDGPTRELLQQRYFAERTVREIAEESTRGYSALTMQLLRIRKSLAACIRRQLESKP